MNTARYTIYENGELVNIIVASPEFVETYCAENGYTYEEIPQSEPEPEPEPTTEPTVWDELDAAYTEGVNTAYDE